MGRRIIMRTSVVMTRAKAWIKEALFPRFCIGCNREGTWFCSWCQDHFDAECLPACPGCNMPTLKGMCCKQCDTTQALSGSVSLGIYEADLPLAKLITAYKYAFAEELADQLQTFIHLEELKHVITDWQIDVVIPVPLHPRRYAERGFNQAEPITEALAAYTGRNMVDGLRRTKYTTKQARLSKRAREQNVRGAFSLANNEMVAGKNILLVDDVYTTGATMAECAMVLKEAGAARVFGFTLARGK